MDNITVSKNMAGWSQKEIPMPTNEEIAILVEEISNDNNFSLSLDNEITMTVNLIENINVLYAMKAHKELYDAKIHLSLVHHLLKTVKAGIDF
jgi:hypothetical protein